MNFRNALIGLMAATIVTGLASCGGDDGGGTENTYSVGGTLVGSVGTVVLRINGAGDISMTTPGSFTFAAGLPVSAAYSVAASGAQNCNVANGTGTMGSTNITNVAITCTTVVRSASLTGAQESPPNASTASGRGAVIVNPATREITGGIVFTGLTPSAGGHHIHQAPSGNASANGPVIVGLVLTTGGGVATVPAGTVLTEAQYVALLAGELYFNVHSSNNRCPPAPTCAAGEIRGQINLRGGVTAGLALLNGASEVPPNASTATGRGMIVFDSTTREVLMAYATHNVATTTVAHIHTGAAGASGPPNVVTLTQGTGVYFAPNPSTLSAQNVVDLNAGSTYFNIHSSNNLCPPALTCAAGEIRGQIAVQ